MDAGPPAGREPRRLRVPVLGRVKTVSLERASHVGRGNNAFDVLRLAAALLVVFHHSFALTATTSPLSTFQGKSGANWGALGVLTFFSISGFLIARSWAYDPHLLSFAAKRALRLLPALVVSLTLTAFLLGPLVTSLPVSTYLEQPVTKGYVALNSVMWTQYTLPGVFESNDYPNAVNGSLWTLSLEVKAYLLIAVIGAVGVFRRRGGMVLVGLFAVMTSLWTFDNLRDALPLGNRLVAMLFNTQAGATTIEQAKAGALNDWARPFAAFMIGAALFGFRRWIPLRWDIAGFLVAVWAVLIVASPVAAPHALLFLLPYLVLMLAYRTPSWFRLPRWSGDYSYGIYILAFPIQQALDHWVDPASGWTMLVMAVPIALVLAALSWHLVEARALTLKQRLVRPLDAAAEEASHPDPRVALQPASAG